MCELVYSCVFLRNDVELKHLLFLFGEMFLDLA